MCNWQKWILPGFITVLVVTALLSWLRAGAIEQDLQQKALSALQGSHGWATVEMDGRDLTLGGTAPSGAAVDEALEIADNAYDVRVVSNATDALPAVDPFRVTATKSADNIMLTGNVPSDEVRQSIVNAAEAAAPGVKIDDQMTLASGAPEGFSDLASFGISQLTGLTEGTATISGTELSVEGTANSLDAFDGANTTLAGAIPGGSLKLNGIKPPSIIPFVWSADFDGSTITLDGLVPDSETATSIEAAAKAANPDAAIANQMRVAGGAPDGFAGMAEFGLGFLPKFSTGKVSLFNDVFNVSGSANSPENYDAARSMANALPGGFTLGESDIRPSGLSSYAWNARIDGDSLNLGGFVPSEEARAAQAAAISGLFPGAKINDGMKVASGAAATYGPSTDYSYAMLARFAQGEADLVDDRLSVRGTARSLDDYAAALELAANPPNGVTLANAEISPPVIKPYRMTAEKAGNKITLAGFMPNETTRKAAVAAAGEANPGAEITDNLKIAAGVPDGVVWPTATGYALRMLGRLESGNTSIFNDRYIVRGAAKSSDDYVKAITSIRSGLGGGMKLSQQRITPPLANPYRWSVQKSDSGIKIGGNVADPDAGDAVAAMVREEMSVSEVTDNQQFAVGEPAGFNDVRRTLSGQIARLENGLALVAGTDVRVTGFAKSEDIAVTVERAIEGALPDGYSGQATITFPVREAPAEEVAACQQRIDQTIAGKTIQFEVNRAIIRAQSHGLLDSLASVLAECPDVRIEIAGHTDSDGSEDYNQRLSEGRSAAVRDYLRKAGVPGGRMIPVGFGESQPVADNATSEGKAQNRRIEFKALK